LIPLTCLKCGLPIPAAPDEVAWACTQCGQGQRLATGPAGLAPLEIRYSAGIAPHALGRPFWVAEGRVSLQRQTFGSARTREVEEFWAAPRRFFIPAYACPLPEVIHAGLQYLAQPPALQPGSPAAFHPVSLAPEDMAPLVEFVIMAVEAGRKDKLRQVNISLELAPPDLWVLP
jgi:hypothetical protein